MAENTAKDEAVLERSGSLVQAILGKGYVGGELQAAFFQGANELGAALRAFPDAIQIEEPGTAFNPLYRDRDGATPAHAGSAGPEADTPLRSPAEIAEASRGSVHGETQVSHENAQAPSDIAAASRGSVFGQHQQESQQMQPSPSDIARDPGPPQQQEHGQEHEHEQSRGR